MNLFNVIILLIFVLVYINRKSNSVAAELLLIFRVSLLH